MSRFHLITASGAAPHASYQALANAIDDLAAGAPIRRVRALVGHPALGPGWSEGLNIYIATDHGRDWIASAAGPDFDADAMAAALAALLDVRPRLAA